MLLGKTFPRWQVGRLGLPELLIIGLIILVLFGAPRIPQLMRGLGQGIREFRREIRGGDDGGEGPKEPK